MNTTVRGWLITIAVLAIVLGAVVFAGGFERRPNQSATPYTGETYELARWDVRFLSCNITENLVNPSARDLNVRAMVVNTSDESLIAINRDIIRFETPTGEIFGTGGGSIAMANEDQSYFDPGFPVEAVFSMPLEQPTWPADEPLVIRLADETLGDSYLSSEKWVFDREIAKIELICEGNP